MLIRLLIGLLIRLLWTSLIMSIGASLLVIIGIAVQAAILINEGTPTRTVLPMAFGEVFDFVLRMWVLVLPIMLIPLVVVLGMNVWEWLESPTRGRTLTPTLNNQQKKVKR